MKTVAKLGDIYGRLTIVHISDRRTVKGSVIVVCMCTCGNLKETNMKSLRANMVSSCGCLRKEVLFKIHSLPKGEAGRNELYSKYRKTAFDRGLKFDLSKDEFEHFTKGHCHYCGSPPSNVWQEGRYNGDYVWNGIDRKNSSIGYDIYNCVSCCTICNRAKGTIPYLDFINWVKRITLNVGNNQKELEEIKL